LVPFSVVTKMLAVPAVPAGVVQLMVVALVTLKLLHALPPTLTAVAPVKLLPVMVMEVKPSVDPKLGETELIVGASE